MWLASHCLLLLHSKMKKIVVKQNRQHLRPPSYLSRVLRSWKVGLLEGSYDQHSNIIRYNEGGQFGGRGSRSPFSILPITSLFLTPWKGLIPYIRISHIHTPKHIKKIKKTKVSTFYPCPIQMYNEAEVMWCPIFSREHYMVLFG